MTETNRLLDALKDLHALQAEIEDPKLDAENPHFRSQYTSLREVLRIARPLLNKHNFVLMQRPITTIEGRMELLTELCHLGGYIFSSNYALKPVKDDPQNMGGAVTYARRFSIKPMLGMSDADDDGNEAIGLPAKPEKKPSAPRIDPKVARQQNFMKWAKDNEEITNAFLHARTYGKDGEKVAWLDETASWEGLAPAQLDVILKSDKNLAAFKNAVLAFNQITP